MHDGWIIKSNLINFILITMIYSNYKATILKFFFAENCQIFAMKSELKLIEILGVKAIHNS